MKDANKRLDAGARAAARAEDVLRRVAKDARDGADEACAAGLFDLSAQLHEVAGQYEIAAARARIGYGKGRAIRCELPGGGLIQPQGGGKD